MPLKFIAFIFLLFIIVCFVGFNLENSSNIRIWFGEKGELKDVPIFVSFFVMYLIGLLSAIPFSLRKKKRKPAVSEEPGEPDKRKIRILGARKKSETAEPPSDAEKDGVQGADLS